MSIRSTFFTRRQNDIPNALILIRPMDFLKDLAQRKLRFSEGNMKYGNSRLCYVDKNLNLVTFHDRFNQNNRSGHAHLKKNISVKKWESLERGRPATEYSGANWLRACPEFYKR